MSDVIKYPLSAAIEICEQLDNMQDQRDLAMKVIKRLERERDEAIEHWEEVQEYGTDEINAAVDLRQKLAQALVELDNMQDQRDLAMKVISRLENERDEAQFLLKAAQSALDAIHLEVGGWIKTMKENTD